MAQPRQLAEDVWVVDQELRFLGVQMGSRMTCLRQPGGLLLHSPVRLDADLLADVRRLGEPRWLVAPNRFHHLSIGDWARALPEARVLVAPGLEARRSDLGEVTLLGADVDPGWGAGIETIPVRGIPALEETVFFHRPSATLVLTDLAFHLDHTCAFSARVLGRLNGTFGALAPTRLERLLVRDRGALRETVRRILDWPFERVVMGHGSIVESGGRRALATGFHWLLDDAGGAD